jgi:potassium efflux system protein
VKEQGIAPTWLNYNDLILLIKSRGKKSVMRNISKKFLIAAIILSVLIWGWIKFSDQNDTDIHIAFVGPMSGDSAIVGQSMAQALQLYLDSVNDKGGINGQQVVLNIFDDQNDADKALKEAKKIVEQNRAIAVIGHNYSACSINGGKVYKAFGIPAITPASTHVDVTRENEWYFRTVFNDHSQARFLANYAKHILKQLRVSIIYTDTPYGNSLASQFEKNSRILNISVQDKWQISDGNQETQMKSVVSELQSKSETAGLIFLATHVPEGVKLVKFIRQAGIKNIIIVPDSYASRRFLEGFVDDKLLADLYVSTPFILDTGNKEAHQFNANYQNEYSKQPLPWQAFYAVDAANVLIEAVKKAQIDGLQESLVTDRKKIRQALAQLTLENAIDGYTGKNYFDEHGDATKSISMGIYKKNHLISAFDQLKIVPSYSDKPDSSAPQDEQVLLIDDQYMYKTQVVYTGFQLNSLSELNSNSYTLDFYLWFRYQGDIEPDKIHFLNAVEPTQLTITLVEEEMFDQQKYRLYRIKGQFNGILESTASLTRRLLSVNFRHKELERNRLIYVADVLGMNSTKPENLQSIDDWIINKINWFSSVFKPKELGNPKYLELGNQVEYSTFNVEIGIFNNAYAYYTLFDIQYVGGFLILTAVITVLMILFSYYCRKIHRLKTLWLFQIVFALLLLILTERFAIQWIIEHPQLIPIEIIITAFNVLWWIIPAILLHMTVERFLWLPLEDKTGRTVPNLMRFLTALVIYLLALFGIIGFVFERPLTSLLATSGVAAMIIGLAVQMNLSNVFSGIALNIERSLRIGDWVKIGAYDEGKVFNMNWRVTQIETRRGYILSIPNSTVSNSDIHNFSYPDDQYWLLCRVPIDPKYDPRKIEQILINAVLSVEQDVVKDFKPSVWIDTVQVENVSDWVASYLIFYKTENYQHKFRVMKNVWKSIWVHLNQAGIMSKTTTPVSEPKSEQKSVTVSSQAPKSEAELNTVAVPSELAKVLTKNQLQNMMNGVN